METKSVVPPSFNNMSDADLDALMQHIADLKTKRASSKNSIVSFTNEYLEVLKSSNSKKYVTSVELTFKNLLEHFGEEKSLSEITRVDAEKFIAKLKVAAPKGYLVYFRNIKAAFNVAIEWEYITANPFTKVKLAKCQKEKPAFITKAQLELIMNAMDNETLKIIVYYAFFTGSRRGEILNLRWRNIDFDKKTITIGDEDYQTKTRSQRIVPMADSLYSKLWDWSRQGKISSSKPNGFVFAKPNGFLFHEDVPSKAFKRACRKVGIDKKVHFHSLRHSFASYLVQKDVELYNVKELMGHSSVTTTEIYAHLNIDALQKSVSVFDKVDE